MASIYCRTYKEVSAGFMLMVRYKDERILHG